MSTLIRSFVRPLAGLLLAVLLAASHSPAGATRQGGPPTLPATPPTVGHGASNALLADQPALIFAEDHGPDASFRIWGRDAAVRIGPEGVEIERVVRRPAPPTRVARGFAGRSDGLWLRRLSPEFGDWTMAEPPAIRTTERVQLRLVGARPALVEGLEPRSTSLNFFHGPPEAWRTGLPSFGGVRMREPWPGIDIVWRADSGSVQAQIVAAPGASLDRVAFELEGAATHVDAEGVLHAGGTEGPLLRLDAAHVPASRPWQVRLDSPSVDAVRTVDDVASIYTGVWGLPDLDRGLGIAVDAEGAAYLTGEAWIDGDREAYVLKVDPSGGDVEFLTFIGGDGGDASFDIVVDAEGNSYFCGATSSTESSFPVVGGPQRTFQGVADVLVASLDATGETLRYAGYLGGARGDFCEGIQVDAHGQVYLTGVVASDDFPAKVGPDLSHNGMTDAFLTMLPAEMTSDSWQDNVVYSGFIGGTGHDVYVYTPADRPEELWATAGHVTVDAAGAAYVSGGTNSDESSFPTGEGFADLPGADRSFGGLWDAWAVKVLPGGAGLAYATYFGGAGEDLGFGMEVDDEGAAYFSGGGDSTAESLGPVVGPGLSYQGGDLDTFAVKVVPDGSQFAYAGYLGSTGTEFATGMSLDAQGRLILVGFVSEGEGFPVKGGPDDTYNSPPGDIGDAFVCRLVADPASAEPIDNVDFCGYIGGAAFDQAFWADVGPDGAVYVVGDTESGPDTFPNGQGMAGHQAPVSEFGGRSDAFVVKLDSPGAAPPTLTPAPTPTTEPTPIATEVATVGATVYLPRALR